MKKFMGLSLISMALVFTACGDNNSTSGGNNNSASSATYDLSTYTYTTIQMNLEGTNYNVPITGTYLSQYTNDMSYKGIMLAVRENIFNIDGEILSTNTGYYQGSQFGVRNSERTCTVDDVSKLTPPPLTATIGYQSGITTFHCTDGAIYEVEQKLTSAGGDNAFYILDSRLIIGGGIMATEHKYTITPNMDIIAYEGSINGGGWDLQVAATTITQDP